MSGVEIHSVSEEEAGLRLDRWFRHHFPALSHGPLEKLLRSGQIRLDGKRAKAGVRLVPGQAIRVPPLPECAPEHAPERAAPPPSAHDSAALRARVLYRDDWLIAIDKPAGLAVQGGSGQGRHLDAMSEALRFDAAEPPRLVHRLDKDTSGVLLLARTARAARLLTATFREQAARKTYWAAVAGRPRKKSGLISLPLLKRPLPPGAPGRGERVSADGGEGREAVTRYAVLQTSGKTAAWLGLRPLTGRTHQLRVHCAAMGHPILGDGKYGGKAAFLANRDLAHQLHLHAREIAIPHPQDGTTLRVVAPLPAHMESAWRILGFDLARGERSDSLEG